MKRIISLFIAIYCLSVNGFAQESFSVTGLEEGKQWQIIEKAIYDNGLEIGKFYEDEQVLYTNWVQWNAITIQNRGLIEIKLKGHDLTVSMVKRGYKTTDGWADAIGKLSKKNKKKFLLSLTDRITEINDSQDLSSNAVLKSKLFPAFNPINTVNGIKFTLNSVSQDLNSANKALTISFSVKNTSDIKVKMEVNLWGAKELFLGVPVKMENYKLDGHAGGERFHKELMPNETASYFAHYKCSDIINEIPKYNQSFRANGKRVDLSIYDIKLPYGTNGGDVKNDEMKENSIPLDQAKGTGSGVYDNFVFVKTDNAEMPLMAVHEDGSMIGFQLDNNTQRIVSLIFRKDINAPDFVLLFDKEGKPKGGSFGDNVYLLKDNNGDNYKAITLDKQGNYINEVSIKLSSSPKINQSIAPNNNRKGPNVGEIPFSISSEEGLLEWLQEQSRILNIVGCAVSIPSGLGAVGPCGTLIIDEILRVLPEDHIYYDELVLAKEILSIVTFSSPAGFLDKLTTITGAMATSVATCEELIEKYFPEATLNELRPYVATSEQEYVKENGFAVVHINYSKFLSEKEKTISIFKIEADNTTSFFKEFEINKMDGELAFETSFNGTYEVRVLYDNVLKNKILYSVIGEDASSNSKYKNYKCIYFRFSGGVHAKYYSPNKQPEPETTSILPFDIDYWTCIDSENNGYHLTPLNISWIGNKFQATATRKFSFSIVSYQIDGEISNDGKTLKNITIKVTSIWEKEYDHSVQKEVKEVWLGNIPYDSSKESYKSYINKYGSIPNATEAIKHLKYKKTILYPENTENNYLVKYVPEENYWTARDGNFSFELKFNKPN